MKITLLCTNKNHPVMPYLEEWQSRMNVEHDVDIVDSKEKLSCGDILYLVSCSQIIGINERKKYGVSLVLHASDLPKGRGWSPYIWSIIKGMTEIIVCVIEANDSVDTGDIWLRKKITLQGHELLPEINEILFRVELDLMTEVVEQFDKIKPKTQLGDPGSYMPRRTPEDSRLDPSKSIAEQFDLLRVVDSDRFPAFLDFRGVRYILKIEKANEPE